MADTTMGAELVATIEEARVLASSGEVRSAIDVLSQANRAQRRAELEVELVRLRRGAAASRVGTTQGARPRISAEPGDDRVFEIDAGELSARSVRSGLARSGCVLVRGLVPPHRAESLAVGIDTALAAGDAAATGEEVDPGWYSPGSMPDRVSGGLPEDANRRFLRERGGMWTADSPHMLFELFETVDAVGIGALMTEFLGERPFLSAHKCTLRRVPPDLVVMGGWHQDGSFLGNDIGAFNLWLSLSHCGRDAPGLDIVPKRVERVLPSDEEARFDWSLSDAAVNAAAAGAPIVRPEFRPGDALLFDHLLVHRTATSPEMTQQRHAIESWFFSPSAWPVGQIPILY